MSLSFRSLTRLSTVGWLVDAFSRAHSSSIRKVSTYSEGIVRSTYLVRPNRCYCSFPDARLVHCRYHGHVSLIAFVSFLLDRFDRARNSSETRNCCGSYRQEPDERTANEHVEHRLKAGQCRLCAHQHWTPLSVASFRRPREALDRLRTLTHLFGAEVSHPEMNRWPLSRRFLALLTCRRSPDTEAWTYLPRLFFDDSKSADRVTSRGVPSSFS